MLPRDRVTLFQISMNTNDDMRQDLWCFDRILCQMAWQHHQWVTINWSGNPQYRFFFCTNTMYCSILFASIYVLFSSYMVQIWSRTKDTVYDLRYLYVFVLSIHVPVWTDLSISKIYLYRRHKPNDDQLCVLQIFVMNIYSNFKVGIRNLFHSLHFPSNIYKLEC